MTVIRMAMSAVIVLGVGLIVYRLVLGAWWRWLDWRTKRLAARIGLLKLQLSAAERRQMEEAKKRTWKRISAKLQDARHN